LADENRNQQHPKKQELCEAAWKSSCLSIEVAFRSEHRICWLCHDRQIYHLRQWDCSGLRRSISMECMSFWWFNRVSGTQMYMA
jgi:hypothetical protein